MREKAKKNFFYLIWTLEEEGGGRDAKGFIRRIK